MRFQLAVLCFAAAAPLAAQPTRAELIARIDSLANIPLARRQVAGMTIAVDGVFGRRSAHYQFIRTNGKVTAVRADLVAVNTVLVRQ